MVEIKIESAQFLILIDESQVFFLAFFLFFIQLMPIDYNFLSQQKVTLIYSEKGQMYKTPNMY
ncbi:hypothetical protein CMT37_12875 [Elizabethkingia anophelis]|nr:hypothetical protein [Elizabethkingia anophelis]